MDLQTSKVEWLVLVLAGLIAANTIVLIICLTVDPKTTFQADVIKLTVPVTHDLFKIIVGAVVGALGTTVGMRRT